MASVLEDANSIRILKLVDGEHNDGVLYRLKKGWKVHFMLGPTLAAYNVTVYCNAPTYDRPLEKRFRQLAWISSGGGDKLNDYAPLQFLVAGSFKYYLSRPGKENAGSGYFVVDPVITVGAHGNIISLDGLCIQSVLTKSLGPLSEWKDRLQVARESGYNGLHFTPIQLLGSSQSSYSIADQLRLNKSIHSADRKATFDDISNLVEKIRLEWLMISTVDVVWNHTATSSDWIKAHPECGYNLVNSPHLRPAYLLDRALFHLSMSIANGEYQELFEDNMIKCENDVKLLETILSDDIIPSLALWEFFQTDIELQVDLFQSYILSNETDICSADRSQGLKISLIQDKSFTRFGCCVDMPHAVSQFYCTGQGNLDDACKAFRDTLIWLNKCKREETENDMKEAVGNIIKTVIYERIADHGPKMSKITKVYPLNCCYFTHPYGDTNVSDDEANMNDPSKCQLIMAHNGWVMGQDALNNFAVYPSMVYFRRQLVCWGDSIKLRYGERPQDCPYLWNRMKAYTEKMAKIFHGIRIDNCHSTPIHVAEYMLDAARTVRPDIFIFAELFTANEHVDNLFVNRLGITSLVREALSAHNAQDLGRLVYLYGGKQIASFAPHGAQPLRPSRAHALFYDVTHDNESMIVKHSIYDVLPCSALVAMSCCSIGSNRGHDEMVPHHIHVVNEDRLYRKWGGNHMLSEGVNLKSGIIGAKLILNMLHQSMAHQGFSEVFVDQRSSDIVAVTRHNPVTHDSFVMVASTCFQEPCIKHIPSITIEGKIAEIVLEAKPHAGQTGTEGFITMFKKHSSAINGIDDFQVSVEANLPLTLSSTVKVVPSKYGKENLVCFTDFPPGSIIVLRVTSTAEYSDMHKVLALLHKSNTIFDMIISKFDLSTLNYILFCCKEEQQSYGLEISGYAIPGWRELHYCGIAGITCPLKAIVSSNDLGHPICNNLRSGNWLPEYVANRLLMLPKTKALGEWYRNTFRVLAQLPRFIIPTYFEKIMSLTYAKLLNACFVQMSPFVSNGGSFVKSLALATVSLCGNVKGATLPPVRLDAEVSHMVSLTPSMAAGLPHFCSGVMRCWGRDTFIAFRGLMVVTGRNVEAKNMILSFARCVRHGLIPNLLGEGKISRYNCRDAVWFWLQSIQEYCLVNGLQLLKTPVARIFPNDGSEPIEENATCMPLYNIVQEVMQRHIDGISFRERNAGVALDMNMTSEGFNVEAGVNLNTGFVYGGNQFNCGTWMDKMGESVKAGTKGRPATPRDGSAIELVGLCKSTVRWLQELNNSGKYPYDGVFAKDQLGQVQNFSWSEWNERIAKNFEKCFFVDVEDKSNLVHKRFIYKDTVRATHPWCDYQLRPNFPIAMVYAPELFRSDHAWQALQIAQDKLLGPLGMKTLDPDDMQYRANYDNANDSDDSTIAKGFNYHQGPEWLWPVGYFLRAKLYFARQLGDDFLKETVHFIYTYLAKHQLHLESSEWFGMPELTNSNGAFCRDSCPIQAWSHATLLDLLHDLSKIRR